MRYSRYSRCLKHGKSKQIVWAIFGKSQKPLYQLCFSQILKLSCIRFPPITPVSVCIEKLRFNIQLDPSICSGNIFVITNRQTSRHTNSQKSFLSNSEGTLKPVGLVKFRELKFLPNTLLSSPLSKDSKNHL